MKLWIAGVCCVLYLGAAAAAPMSSVRTSDGRSDAMGAALRLSPAGLLLAQPDALRLTDDQIRRLTTLNARAQQDLTRRQADLSAALLDLAKLVQQPDAGRERVEAAAREVGRQYAEMAAAQSRAFLDAQRVLTPEQRRDAASLYAGILIGMARGPDMLEVPVGGDYAQQGACICCGY